MPAAPPPTPEPSPEGTPRSAGSTPSDPGQRRGRWVAIVTGAISVLVAVLYLILIAVLDSRGPLQPPPPEAFGQLSVPSRAGGAAAAPAPATVPPPG
jgi:hypothetical protein